VPRDAAALSVGADETAQAIVRAAAQRNADVELVRNGSRGLLWLEPLVEVETPGGRIAYGPVTADDVAALFEAGWLQGEALNDRARALRHGVVDEIPFFKRQQRLTFARCGLIDPLNLDEYRAHGGYRGLENAIGLGPRAVVEQVMESGLRGRGGAAFPAGIKWRTVLETAADQKYVACNADEGDSGTYSDRMILEGDPFALIEGMTIAGFATGATRGFVYLRCEYPDAHRVIEDAISIAYAHGFLGRDVLGRGVSFDLE
jgi:formate dehydrogenase iron-sulfur subunit